MRPGPSRNADPAGLAVTVARVRAGVPAAGEAGAARNRPGDPSWSPGFFLVHPKGIGRALNRFNARPMPFGWTLNPYRGCEMACKYCFARYTHEFLGENDPVAFERRIYVKLTDRDSLVAELTRARKSALLVALGTATDPYHPAETTFQVTRRVLEAAARVGGGGLSITTRA